LEFGTLDVDFGRLNVHASGALHAGLALIASHVKEVGLVVGVKPLFRVRLHRPVMETELMCRVVFVEHQEVFCLSHFKLDGLPFAALRPLALASSAKLGRMALMLLIQSVLSLFSLAVVPLRIGHHFFIIFCQNLLFVDFSDFTHAVLRELFLRGIELFFWWALRLHDPLSRLELLPLFLLLLYKFDKLLDVLHWVEIDIIEVFASRAIHKFMFLARQIGDNPF